MDMNTIKEEAGRKSRAALYDALRGVYRAAGRLALNARPSPQIPQAAAADWQSACGKRFCVGFGKATLLPDDFLQKTYYVAGYSENNPATGCLDEPYAHAVWLDDQTGRGAILLVTADTVGLLNADVEQIRAELSDFCRTTDCRGVHIMSTHDHASIDTMGNWGPLPRTGRDKAYMAFFRAQVKSAAIAAYRDRRDGDLYLGETEVPDMQEDIRTPYVFSRTLTRLRFVPKDGTRETWLVHFASHSESLQGCNSRVSADFPGYMRRAIFEQTGAETAYFVGAIGGMISMKIDNEREIRDAGGDFAASTKAIGEKLAGYALSIRWEKKLKPCINQLRQTFYVDADNTMLLTAKYAGILRAKSYRRRGTALGLALRTEMTYLAIGQLSLLLVPGELFPELAYGGYLDGAESATGLGAEADPEPLTQIAGDPALRIVGLANDELGYILPPNDFLLHPETPYFSATRDRHGRRHYEETNSLGPRTAETIATVFRTMMAQIDRSRA
ncbi:MAG: hypothetical protein IJT44_13050 [Clostridia bacterium]|nr:hypothetical protein [Clostridia bacterium]